MKNKRVCGQNLSNVSLDLRKTKHSVEILNCHSMDCQQKSSDNEHSYEYVFLEFDGVFIAASFWY